MLRVLHSFCFRGYESCSENNIDRSICNVTDKGILPDRKWKESVLARVGRSEWRVIDLRNGWRGSASVVVVVVNFLGRFPVSHVCRRLSHRMSGSRRAHERATVCSVMPECRSVPGPL
ncbi:hypothetical protein J6590_105305 [Homalodisca vitripennis]|nr:hypothetical protein J6590_105305 [Homalodisca vitripennis]